MTTLDQLAETPERRVLLACSDPDVDGIGELRVRLVLIGLKRLFDPEDAKLLEGTGDLDRRLRVAAVSETRVDQHGHLVAASFNGSGCERNVMVGVLTLDTPAELDRGKAKFAHLRDGLAHFGRRVRHQPRCVRAHLVALLAAKQLVDRLTEGLPLDVPERDIDAADGVQRDAATADVDQPAVHLLPEPLDVHRIFSDEQFPQAVGDGVGTGGVNNRLDRFRCRIDLTNAGNALVGVDKDDKIVLASVCDSLVQRRLSKDHRLDIRDLHESPPRKSDCSGQNSGPKARLSTIEQLSTIAKWLRQQCTAPSISTRQGSTLAVSNCRAQTIRAAGRTSSFRSSR